MTLPSVIRPTAVRASPPIPMEPRCLPTNFSASSYPRTSQAMYSPANSSPQSSLASLASPFASVSISPRSGGYQKLPPLHHILSDHGDMNTVPAPCEPLYYNTNNRPWSSRSLTRETSAVSPREVISPDSSFGTAVDACLSQSTVPHLVRPLSAFTTGMSFLRKRTSPGADRKSSPNHMAGSKENHHGDQESRVLGEHDDDLDDDDDDDDEEEEYRPIYGENRRYGSDRGQRVLVTPTWRRTKSPTRTKNGSPHRSTGGPTPITKPRWQDAERQALFDAIIMDKQLEDMATYRWDKVANVVGRPKKACKDQWRREVFPGLKKYLQTNPSLSAPPSTDASDAELS